MSAEIVPLESFLHISHRTNGVCSIVDRSGHYPSRGEGNLHESFLRDEVDNAKVVRVISLATFDSMLLLKITKKSHEDF